MAFWSVRYGTTWPIYSDQLNGSQSCVSANAYITIDGPLHDIGAYGETACY